MDKTGEVLQRIEWRYARQDSNAKDELEARITAAARKRALITYSDLVRGITFRLPSLVEPVHTIDTNDWQDLDRVIVGDFLGYLSMESYER